MEREWRQLLVAAVLGICLPGLCLVAGSLLIPERSPPPVFMPQTTLGTQPQEEPEKKVFLTVLQEDGHIRAMELEVYICGVVLAEMRADFESEALKAQAVAARTYAMRHMRDSDRHIEAVVCTDSGCCQAYISDEAYLQERGDSRDLEKVRQAVAATAGEVLTYGGAYIEATYFSCSGGRTEDSQAVWGQALPYLQSVESPGEEGASAYSQETVYTPGEFCTLLGRKLTGKPESWFGTLTRTRGGGVDRLVIGGMSYTGTELRRMLVLSSTAFTVTVENGVIRILTLGRGHRVGMSQYGAEAMAVTGRDYREILSHYYPGTRIDKLSAMG